MVMPVLVLDPGHPSRPHDRGVVHKGFVESEWALHMALLTREALQWLPIAVELTRYDQEPVSLKTRGKLSSQKYQADLVISIHANAHRDSRVNGMMAFSSRGG